MIAAPAAALTEVLSDGATPERTVCGRGPFNSSFSHKLIFSRVQNRWLWLSRRCWCSCHIVSSAFLQKFSAIKVEENTSSRVSSSNSPRIQFFIGMLKPCLERVAIPAGSRWRMALFNSHFVVNPLSFAAAGSE